MENLDKQIKEFIDRIAPETGGIDKLAQMEIKQFVKSIYAIGWQDGFDMANNIYTKVIENSETTKEVK